MKKILIASILPIVTASVTAQAAESAVLNVKGTIIPSACNITLSGNADYGTMVKSKLQVDSATNAYQLGTKEINYLVSCDSPVKTAISFKGDEVATKNPGYSVKVTSSSDAVVSTGTANQLGVLGSVNGTDIGYYVVLPTTNRGSAEGIVIDGVTGFSVIKSTDNGSSWINAPTSYASIATLDESTLFSWGNKADTILSPKPGTTTAGQLAVGVALNPNVVDSLTDSYSFNSNVTVLLKYI